MRRILSSDTVSLQSKSQFIDTMNRTKRKLLRWQVFRREREALYRIGSIYILRILSSA